MQAVDGRVEATITDGSKVTVDHVVLATGYKIDVGKLTMLQPSLRAAIETDSGFPLLTAWFESSVPGLYFVGLTSLRAFGPLYRFVAGCKATAPRVAQAVARKKNRRRQADPLRAAQSTA
jgi:hypothetical protein